MRFPFLLPRLGLSRPNSACLLVFPVQAAGKAQDYLAIDTFPGNFKKWNGSTLKYVKNQTILMASYHPGSHHRHLLPALPHHPPSWSLCLSPPPRHGGVLRHSVVSHACDPIDCSPPGSSVYGTLQAGTLEWVAIS